MTATALVSARPHRRARSIRLRALGVLGRISMYRLVLGALAIIVGIAFVASLAGLVTPTPLELVASLGVLVAVGVGVDVALQRVRGRPLRIESSLITAVILVLVLRPGTDLASLGALALAAAAASASKHLLVWRGRHVLNPAALGAAVLTISGLGASAWWVATPALVVPVVVLGALVTVRSGRVLVVATFLAVAIAVAGVRIAVQTNAAGLDLTTESLWTMLVVQSPFLFLGAFMLTEPLTTPPRRWQQLLVAALVGALAGWPIALGSVTLGQERALLIGNVIAAVLAARGAIALTVRESRSVTPTVREITFDATRLPRFVAGQHLELEVPHRKPDARGTRRVLSIVSAPADLPLVRVAYREPVVRSSFKRALGATLQGDRVRATGLWGDFVLPRAQTEPVLLVAGGIGVTPFVSQLRQARLLGEDRDIRLVLVASSAAELAFRDELAETGVPTLVCTPDRPHALPRHWRWSAARLDARLLTAAVPDLEQRRASISGPPSLLADLAPTLRGAKSLRTDAFAGA